MTDENRKTLEKFLSACDELVTCKFLVAENKIQKILGALAEAQPVYELVSECMEQFNRDREMAKAFVQEAKGEFACHMPTEEYKIIALIFTILADINSGKIDFNDFVKRFYNDAPNETTCFQRFIEVSFLPFRNLIAEAFGYPTFTLTPKVAPKEPENQVDSVSEPETQTTEKPLYANEDIERKVLRFPSVRNAYQSRSLEGLEKLCFVSQRIASQILDELDTINKHEEQVDELRAICYAIIMASSDMDFDLLRGLTIGLRYASKGVKNIKFLVRELDENVEKFYNDFANLDND